MNLQAESLSFGQLLSKTDIFDNSLCELQFKQGEPKSAVAIIIKKVNQKTRKQSKDFVRDQILFLQRKQSPKDRFSGQICFPGGRQQPNQTLLNAAIRQTFEETNIIITKQQLIGCINRQVNFIISTRKQQSQSQQHSIKKPQKEMVVYTFVFCVQSDFIDSQTIKLNHDQMESYKWVAATEIVNSRNVCWFDYTEKISSLSKVYERNPQIKKHMNAALSCVSRALSPALDVGMNQKMYGITLYIVLILIGNLIEKIEALIKQCQKFKDKQNEQNYRLIQMLCNLKQIKSRCSAHVVFQVHQPLTQEFRQFESALLEGLYKMRPKL